MPCWWVAISRIRGSDSFLIRRLRKEGEERVLLKPEKRFAADSGVYSFSRGIFISIIIFSFSGIIRRQIKPRLCGVTRWARLGSNQGPLTYQVSALPLSY